MGWIKMSGGDGSAKFIKAAMITNVLVAGETSIVLSSELITEESVIDLYVDDAHYSLSPETVDVQDGKVILTFAKAQEDNVTIGIKLVGTESYETEEAKIFAETLEEVSKLRDVMSVKQTVLEAGQTTVTYTNNHLNENTCLFWYADQEHSTLLPTDWTISGNTLTVTYEPQEVNVTVGVQMLEGSSN